VGEVRVLDGQRGQGRRLTGTEGLVEQPNFAKEDTLRPAIVNGVVGRQQADVVLRTQAQLADPEQGTALQVKGAAIFFIRQSACFPFTLAFRQAGEVED
jgi:hypothetical protein